MINPTDFHKTAELLKDEQDEWHVRTTVNRCYYGVFLFFRNFLLDNKVEVPPHGVKSQHQFVINCFEKSKSEARRKYKDTKYLDECKKLVQIYARLRTLHQERMDADYRLDYRFHHNYSGDSLRRAESTIKDFEKLSWSRDVIIKTSVSHAEDVRRNVQ